MTTKYKAIAVAVIFLSSIMTSSWHQRVQDSFRPDIEVPFDNVDTDGTEPRRADAVVEYFDKDGYNDMCSNSNTRTSRVRRSLRASTITPFMGNMSHGLSTGRVVQIAVTS
mgnify:FL=1